jgi:ATP-dependent RNA helicase DHX8/PRP22
VKINHKKIEMVANEIEKDFDVLPVIDFKREILEAISKNQIIICIGETGSGKTTQIPQFILDSGMLKDGLIGITQPRRIAAITVAQRVCEERNVSIGNEIGYSVRFDDKTTEKTKVNYLTDGILVRECLSDRKLSKYSVIMLDEAHERSLNTDILFGLIKDACRMRKELKLIVTSATLDEDKFVKYFNNCPVIRIPGRIYPVDIYHSKTKQVMTLSGPSNNSYIQSAVDIVLKIHRKDGEGHILLFLTGQEEIEKACSLLRTAIAEEEEKENNNINNNRKLIILPLYAALPNETQAKVFKKPSTILNLNTNQSKKWTDYNDKGKKMENNNNNSNILLRKCVIATNIAETSITVRFYFIIIIVIFIN